MIAVVGFVALILLIGIVVRDGMREQERLVEQIRRERLAAAARREQTR